jgi:hypothetical protein
MVKEQEHQAQAEELAAATSKAAQEKMTTAKTTAAQEKSTEELLRELRHMEDVEKFTRANAGELVVPDVLAYLLRTAAAHGVSKKELGRDCLLERTYAAHLLGGSKKLTRDKLLIFALVGKFTPDETQTLLKYGQVSQLYIRDKRDKLLLFALQEHKTLEDTQELLQELGVPQLSTAPNTREDK